MGWLKALVAPLLRHGIRKCHFENSSAPLKHKMKFYCLDKRVVTAATLWTQAQEFTTDFVRVAEFGDQRIDEDVVVLANHKVTFFHKGGHGVVTHFI